MFETRIQTYWNDADPAGRVYYAHFFRFVDCAETELFRASGAEKMKLLVEWVERGRAPDEIVGTANSGSPWPGRTRPLCPYPKQARYKGGGDVNGAAYFTCEAQEQS